MFDSLKSIPYPIGHDDRPTESCPDSSEQEKAKGKRYSSLYERLVANTRLAVEDNPLSCWLWTGAFSQNGYPTVAIRVPGKRTPRTARAHRLMLELVTGYLFPFDEAGHVCRNPACVNPMHLEIQTKAVNCAERPAYVPTARTLEACPIPCLFPAGDPLADAANDAWDGRGCIPGGACPF